MMKSQDADVKSYLLALAEGHKPDTRPDELGPWTDVVRDAESLYIRSNGNGAAIKTFLSAYGKAEPALARLLAGDSPARVDEELQLSPELQQAMSEKDVPGIEKCVSEIAAFDDVRYAKFKMRLGTLFPGSSFPIRPFEELLRAERRRIARENKKKPVVKSAHDLMEIEFPAQEWIVPGILPQGLVTLAGKQKIGKSWLDYNLCLAVGGGGKAFGSIQVAQGDVLYMALEDNERRLQERFKQLLGPGEEMPRRIDYATEWPRMDADGVEALEEWILSKENPKLIIIDPWVKVKPRVKSRQGETGYDADYEAMEGIKRLVDKYNICILVQFHMRKASADDPMDELNGTSGVTACADGSLFLKRARGESDATLWGTGRSYKEEVDLALKFDGGLWNILGDAKVYAVTKESKEILDVLNQSAVPVKPKELARQTGKLESTIRSRLFEMKKRGEVKDTGDGYISLLPNDANTSNVSNDVDVANTSDDSTIRDIRGVGVVRDIGTVDANAKEALVLLSEVQALFSDRAGIRQIWRDDINPTRQFLPDTYLKKVKAAIDADEPQGIQLAITAMKWTTGKLSPGRNKDE